MDLARIYNDFRMNLSTAVDHFPVVTQVYSAWSDETPTITTLNMESLPPCWRFCLDGSSRVFLVPTVLNNRDRPAFVLSGFICKLVFSGIFNYNLVQ